MAIQTIKEIINSKGYLIDSKDRQIFENGDLRSFFGLSTNDAIEFIIYDINNNQLPQSDGKLVRYIPLSTENIRDYLLIPDGTIFQRYQLPKEYFVDVERLLREAGYDNGIFKTQITLVNKRIGSDYVTDKLWISEISPSRTEVRLFPLKKNQRPEILQNLQERFDLFKRDGQFREDTITEAFAYVEKINPSIIGTYLKAKYGNVWFSTLVDGYKISDFDKFITEIHSKFLEGCVYEFTNRISNINDINYGKPKDEQVSISLDVVTIKSKIQRILVTVLKKYLLQTDNLKLTSFVLNDINENVDDVDRILVSSKSDVIVQPKETEAILTKVEFIKPMVNENKKDLDNKINELIKDIKTSVIVSTKDTVVVKDTKPALVISTPVNESNYVKTPPTSYTDAGVNSVGIKNDTSTEYLSKNQEQL
jgi:hypothetical protein